MKMTRLEKMMNPASRCIAMLVILAATSWQACAVEQSNPLHVEIERIRTLFEEGRFSELDAIELRSRDLGSVIVTGQPVRAIYFWGVDGCGCEKTRQERFDNVAKAQRRLEAWRKANPQSRSVELLPAKIAVRTGYAYRGPEYADKVAPEDWAVFHENIRKASELLDAVSAETRDDSQWYVEKLVVLGLGSASRAEYEAFLETALSRYPLNLGLYFEAVEHFLPKWGGSNDQLRNFIDASAARTRDAWGDMLYARLHWSTKTKDMFTSKRTDWKRMKTSFQEIVEKYPHPWNLNSFASFACDANDFQTVADLLPRVRNAGAMIPAWGSMGNYQRCADLGEMTAQAASARRP